MAYNADVYFQEFKKNYKIGSKEPDSCLVAVIAQPSDHTLKFWKNLKHLTTHILYEKKNLKRTLNRKFGSQNVQSTVDKAAEIIFTKPLNFLGKYE